jgi:hypothetical protein
MRHFERSLDATGMSKRPLITIPWRSVGVRGDSDFAVGRDEQVMRRSD